MYLSWNLCSVFFVYDSSFSLSVCKLFTWRRHERAKHGAAVPPSPRESNPRETAYHVSENPYHGRPKLPACTANHVSSQNQDDLSTHSIPPTLPYPGASSMCEILDGRRHRMEPLNDTRLGNPSSYTKTTRRGTEVHAHRSQTNEAFTKRMATSIRGGRCSDV